MYLSRLSAVNFRKLCKADFEFHKSLNVIVGENNSGKTALIDAIRSVLGDRHFEQDDLHYNSANNQYESSASITAIFEDLDVSDEALLLDALIPSKRVGEYNALIRALASQRGDLVQREMSAGPNPRGGSAYDALQQIRIAYLPALRDPNSSTGLRPGRQSQIANLLRRVTDQAQRDTLVEIARKSNKQLIDHQSVESARKLLEANLIALSGPSYAQRAGLSFVDPEFNRIAATLEAIAEDMQIGMNGLGASNLYYVAAVLADLAKDKSVRYRALLIEEPEAHLHPHYQVLLLRFLKSTSGDRVNPVQVFVTTHSPTLASQAASDAILPLIYASGVGFKAVPIPAPADLLTKTRIRQYLDVTSSEIFFARRILLVEGDAELFLVPALATLLGIDLAVNGVSVVSAAGLNFKTFLPFISGSVLNVPVAILTDKDPPVVKDPLQEIVDASAYYRSLVEAVNGDPQVEVFGAARTFEYDLALPIQNRKHLLAAMESVRPRKTADFIDRIGDLTGASFASSFFDEFFGADGRTSKAEFAMALSILIVDSMATDFVVPPYLVDAIQHLMQEATHD